MWFRRPMAVTRRSKFATFPKETVKLEMEI